MIWSLHKRPFDTLKVVVLEVEGGRDDLKGLFKMIR